MDRRWVFLLQDEFEIELRPLIRKGLSRRGQQREIRTTGETARVYLYLAVNWHTGRIYTRIFPKRRWIYFRRFLRWALQSTQRKIKMVMDESPIHTAHGIGDFLKAYRDRITWVPLPKKSPFSNDAERVGRRIKYRVFANRFYGDIARVIYRIRRTIAYYEKHKSEVLKLLSEKSGH